MKYTKKFSLAALMLVAGMGAAQAAVIAGSENTASADVTFANTASSTATITPKTNLMAGENYNGKVIAEAVMSATGGDIVWRWKDSSGVVDQTDIKKITISGKNNAENQLKVRMQASRETESADGWIHVAAGFTENRDAESLTFYTDGAQNVVADIYTLSIDTAAWQA